MITELEYTPDPTTAPSLPTGGRLYPLSEEPSRPDIKGFLLVSCVHHSWGASKEDKNITEDITTKAQADPKRLRATKVLMACDELKNMNDHGRYMKDVYLTGLSTASNIKGTRVMKAEAYTKFAEGWTEHITTYDRYLNAFLAVYDTRVCDQERHLRGSFNREDYPTLEEVREKFGLDINIQPMTNPSQMTGYADEIMDQVTDTCRRMMASSTQDVWKRLLDTTSNLANSLKGTGRLYASNWDKLRDLMNIAPDLLMEADPDMEAHIEDIRKILLTCPREVVRENPILRTEAAEATAEKVAALNAKYQDIL